MCVKEPALEEAAGHCSKDGPGKAAEIHLSQAFELEAVAIGLSRDASIILYRRAVRGASSKGLWEIQFLLPGGQSLR